MKREKWCEGDPLGDSSALLQGSRYPELWGGCYGLAWHWVRRYGQPAAVYRPNGCSAMAARAGEPTFGGLQGWVTPDSTPWQLADADTYSIARVRHTRSDRLQYLSPVDHSDKVLFYLSLCKRAGFTLRPRVDGAGFTREVELCGLFAAPSGPRGGLALQLAEALGANRLDCLGVGLRDWYEARGWFTYRAEPWDAKQAPAGWSGPGETCYYLRKGGER